MGCFRLPGILKQGLNVTGVCNSTDSHNLKLVDGVLSGFWASMTQKSREAAVFGPEMAVFDPKKVCIILLSQISAKKMS